VSTFYFAAKAPIAGQVKTRLGRAIGMAAAAALYAAFLEDLRHGFRDAAFEVAWYVAPAPWRGLHGARFRIQRGDGWAERQSNLFRDAAAAGEGPIVLAATDSPQVRPQRVEEAFDALREHDLVFGPTYDGGYYLVGMRAFQDVLSGVAMSTASALDGALARARARDLTVALLTAEFDVDEEADLPALAAAAQGRADLAATAAALAELRRKGAAA